MILSTGGDGDFGVEGAGNALKAVLQSVPDVQPYFASIGVFPLTVQLKRATTASANRFKRGSDGAYTYVRVSLLGDRPTRHNEYASSARFT